MYIYMAVVFMLEISQTEIKCSAFILSLVTL